MNHASITNYSACKTLPLNKAVLATAMLLIFSSNAGAFSDTPALTQRLVILARQIQESQAQLRQQMAQVEELRRNLAPASLVSDIPGIGRQDNLEKIADDYGIEYECPGTKGGFSISALMSSFTLNPKGSLKEIKEQQLKLCERMVLAKNAQYNESVELIKDVRKREVEIKKLRAAIEGETELGPITKNTNELAALQNASMQDMQYSTAVIKGYESYIGSLKNNQTMLTKAAMRGTNGGDTFGEQLLSTVVQGATLETALRASKKNDR